MTTINKVATNLCKLWTVSIPFSVGYHAYKEHSRKETFYKTYGNDYIFRKSRYTDSKN